MEALKHEYNAGNITDHLLTCLFTEFDKKLNTACTKNEKITILKDMLYYFPNNYKVYFLLGIFNTDIPRLSYRYHTCAVKVNETFIDAHLELLRLEKTLNNNTDRIITILNLEKSANVYISIGRLFQNVQDNKNAEKYYLEGLKYSIEDLDKKILYINLGSIYINLHNFDESLKYNLLCSNIKILNGNQMLIKQIINTENYNFGMIYFMQKKYDLAEEYYLKVINSEYDIQQKIAVQNNLGSLYASYCDPRYLDCYNFILPLVDKKSTMYLNVLENKLLNMHYNYIDKVVLYNEHKKINDIYGYEKINVKKYNHSILRIGYVSPYTPVPMFLHEILKHHDRTKFKIYCFADVNLNNYELEYYDQVVSIINDTTDTVVKKIKDNEIDILIDLAGHILNNRLAVFSKKPAPTQITYLGYPDTTGLVNMDYRITDMFIDKNNVQFNSEKLLFMPRCFLCFDVSRQVNINHIKNDYYVFGGLNKTHKLSKNTLGVWNKILGLLKNSKLLIKLRFDENEKYIKYLMDALNITRDRLIIKSNVDSYDDYLNLYNMCNISLDPFPYSGTTTTCESLLMNVPVVTYYDSKSVHSHNVSASILHASKLDFFIANSPDEYIDIVIRYLTVNQNFNIRENFINAMNPVLFTKEYESLLLSSQKSINTVL